MTKPKMGMERAGVPTKKIGHATATPTKTPTKPPKTPPTIVSADTERSRASVRSTAATVLRPRTPPIA